MAGLLRRFLGRLTWHGERCPGCSARMHELHCDVCGYDVIAKVRDTTLPRQL